jgi:hypothetical protein
MTTKTKKTLLVGDNPFHKISHLSQERARERSVAESSAEKAEVVKTALENGASGFSFSVSDTSLSILKNMRDDGSIKGLNLYPIVPYAFEYVRTATQIGTAGLAERVAKQMIFSSSTAFLGGVGSVLRMEPEGIMKAYIAYETSRINSATEKKAKVSSILLHEVITDMALALNFDWLFKSYSSHLSRKNITPGFNTRNYPFLVKKFSDWNITLNNIVVETQFNKVGFQMNPSREVCEETLEKSTGLDVLAISVLAAGYLTPSEALDYVAKLPRLKGAVLGASTAQQAKDVFALFSKNF